MTTKTIYLPTVYVDEATGEIIEKEQLKNLSYKSKLITNIPPLLLDLHKVLFFFSGSTFSVPSHHVYNTL